MEQVKERNYLREAGRFEVTVLRTESKKSKAGNAMLVVTMADRQQREINAYFVATNQWGLKSLAEFKNAIGVPETAKAETFVGKELLIAVGFQDPNKTGGKLFTNIESYMPLVAVDESGIPADETIPW